MWEKENEIHWHEFVMGTYFCSIKTVKGLCLFFLERKLKKDSHGGSTCPRRIDFGKVINKN